MKPVYSIQGVVVHGNHLGKKLGYPTANLELPENKPFHLSNGVYAVNAEVDGVRYKGMANAGYRPTVAGEAMTVEIHLFGFSGDLYGKTLTVCFFSRIRDEQKFESLELLVQQIHKDKQEALRLLS
jgi:riboflavin kinase/FMN adenylyltransferase